MTHASDTDHMSDTDGGRLRLSTEGLPEWLDPVVRAAETVEPDGSETSQADASDADADGQAGTQEAPPDATTAD